MYRREESSKCRFKTCLNPLCKFQHDLHIPKENDSEYDADHIDRLVDKYIWKGAAKTEKVV